MKLFLSIITAGLFLVACNGDGHHSDPPPPPPPAVGTATVIAANDLGMHCMDREFSVFSILPPYNVVNAQVVKRDNNGDPYVADDLEVNVFYDAKADAGGSINSYSVGKTTFWDYANSLFGTDLSLGEGLKGLYMPGDDPQNRGPQPVEFNLQRELFSAEGIPITPTDDSRNTNEYPLMQISARDAASGEIIGHLDAVVPVSTETNCQNCHATGGIGANRANITWANFADKEIESKVNILKLHDALQSTTLEASQPVLCAQCHYSPVLDLAGTGPTADQINNPNFSSVMHGYHGQLQINGAPVFPPTAPIADTCYQCHPGSITQCLRGAMKTGGMDCNDCHGDMLAVGAIYPLAPGGSIDGTNDGNPRRPWLDLPRCQSCHTGDALDYLTGPDLVADSNWPFRLRQAFQTGDPSASPLLATNKRFAENTNTLYRFSKGHGQIMCEGCHGSTHAEWPNEIATANDNVAAIALQGYAGKIMECTTCHESGSLPATTDGPHGLHNVNDSRWYNGGHEDFFEDNPGECEACHGQNLTGTPLAKMPTARTFSNIEDAGTVTYAKGDLVRCDRCHEMP